MSERQDLPQRALGDSSAPVRYARLWVTGVLLALVGFSCLSGLAFGPSYRTSPYTDLERLNLLAMFVVVVIGAAATYYDERDRNSR